MRIWILTFFMALLPLFGWSQKEATITLRWMEDGVETTRDGHLVIYPVFDESVVTRKLATLPCYLKRFAVFSSQEIVTKLEPLETDTLTFDEPNHYSDDDLLTGDWQVIPNYSNGEALVYVLPIKKQGDKIIRLKKFKIYTKKVPAGITREKTAYIPTYRNESVLNTGNWYKIGITKTGVYHLNYADLIDMGIDPSMINPKNIKIFGQYKGMLPEANSVPRFDDLQENAITVHGEDDGSFDDGDYILFAGQGPLIWRYNPFNGKYEHTNNLYSDTTFYFLSVGDKAGLRVESIDPPSESPVRTITTFLDHEVVDNDLENIALTGKLWLGERFEGEVNSRHFTFDFPNRVLSKSAFIRMHVVAKGIENTYFRAKVNGTEVIDSSMLYYLGSNSAIYAREITRSKNFIDTSRGELDVEVIRETEDMSAIGWLDYILMNAECELKWRNNQMVFGNPASMNIEEVSKFVLSGAPDDIEIWDITDMMSPKAEVLNHENSDVSFNVQGEKYQQFIAFEHDNLQKPVSWKKIPNQNLHGIGSLNMVIITPEKFLNHAKEIAELHRVNDNLVSEVVTTEQVFNEFSSGMQDVSAIRDFMRMLYLRGDFGGKPGYLLFFGDASVDYKDRLPGNNNMIPTFESIESLKSTTSFVTDDFFGLLDENEGAYAVGDLDIGIGRFPVSTIEQANNAVNKIKVYTEQSDEVMRDWRNNICFIADDENMNLHLHQAKTLVSIVDTANPELNINKIFCDAYSREKIPGGYRYPDAHQAINNQVNEGALIVNYTGHGGLTGWAEELILDMPTIRGFSNIHQLPMFITATCEFSRFDDPLFQSAGEMVFLNEHGGGIALMTTTRLAYAHANIALNSRIYFNLNNREGNELPRLGDLIRMSKVPSNSNFLNFVLLGDPALRLAMPKYKVATTSIQSISGKSTDTVQAMSSVTVKGEIRDNAGVVGSFNGYLYPKVFDKESVYTTRGNTPKSFKEDFTLLDKLLYKGKVTVTNGQFEFTFVVPKEIAQHYGYGKLSYYALDTLNYEDASGFYKNIVVGGTDPDAEPDDNGPDIAMFMNGADFVDNEIIDKNSTLYASIADPGGISFTGMIIGRDILLIVDDDFAGAKVINNEFNPDVDSYTSGKIVIPFNNLQDGHHSAAIRAWDLQGNSTEKRINFIVKSDAAIDINDVMVYPNPFSNNTVFRFYNKKGGGNLDIDITIFDIAGRRVGSMNTEIEDAGKEVEIPFDWQSVVDAGNDPGSGVFIYEMKVTDNNSNVEIVRQKLIKLTN